jgi:hypothetical protein
MVSDNSSNGYWWVSPEKYAGLIGPAQPKGDIFTPRDIRDTAPNISKWLEQEEMKKMIEKQPAKSPSSKDMQVGGDHYRQVPNMQPWDIIDAYGLDYYAGNVLKYLLRHKKKNGKEDLEKARHYLTKMIDSYVDAS